MPHSKFGIDNNIAKNKEKAKIKFLKSWETYIIRLILKKLY